MSASRLTIGGVAVPIAACHSCRIVHGRNGNGRKTLRIDATGFYPPALDSINWTLPVTIVYEDLGTDGSTGSLSVLSTGIQRTDDLAAVSCTWSIDGAEATGVAGVVTIGGTSYWATVDRQPIGGVIQRKSNGAGTLLSAWGKSRVTITGEGGSAPAVSGVVAIVSTIYTGNILVAGVAAKLTPETGLISWTVAGEQP